MKSLNVFIQDLLPIFFMKRKLESRYAKLVSMQNTFGELISTCDFDEICPSSEHPNLADTTTSEPYVNVRSKKDINKKYIILHLPEMRFG